MLAISWWVASVIVIFIATIFYVFGYRACEKEQDVELTKKIIEENAHVEIEKYRWDHPMNGGDRDE